MSGAVTTQVGYGRNKGDGSDTQNLQPADEMHRYADQSDSFSSKALGEGGMLQYGAKPLDGDDAKRYSDVLSKQANVMFEKAPAQFNSCLNTLMEARDVRCGICEDDVRKGVCFYSTLFNSVFMTRGYYENNGSPYQDFWSALLHEYSHAIDYNIGSRDAHGFPTCASNGVRLQSTGGKTILECAVEELSDKQDDFIGFVNGNSKTAKLDDELKEILKEKDPLEDAIGLMAGSISKRFGIDQSDLMDTISSLGISPTDSYEDIEFGLQFVFDDNMKDAIREYYEGDSFKGVREDVARMGKEHESLRARIKEKTDEIGRIGFDSALEMSREFSDLNDIMSAVSKGKAYHPKMGNGHDKEYFSDDAMRATEIFAEIGPILAKDGKAAKWLKEKAPKLVSGYFELLQLATESFRKKEGV